MVVALTLSASILGLAACSSDSGKEKVVESKAGDVTQQEFYEALKEGNGDSVLKKLTTVKVLEDKYKVSDKEIKSELDKIKKDLKGNYEQVLEQQGVTEEQLKEDIRLTLLQEKAFTEGVKVDEKDIKKQYDRMKKEIKAQHILVDDKKTAEEVKKKLDDGADFKKLVKEYSTDEGTKEEGGVLDYFSVGVMDPAFEDAVYTLKKGEISKPVQSQHGFHIIEVLDTRKNKDVESYDKEKADIKRDLAAKQVDPTKAQEKLDKMIKDADIKINDKEFKKIFDEEQPASPLG